MIFGTKRNHEIGGITNFETLFSTKSKIGSKNFLKSPFLANFHEISIFESQNIIVRSIWICLLYYLFKFWSWGLINSWKHVVNWSKSLQDANAITKFRRAGKVIPNQLHCMVKDAVGFTNSESQENLWLRFGNWEFVKPHGEQLKTKPDMNSSWLEWLFFFQKR